jgi:hypothetical protein
MRDERRWTAKIKYGDEFMNMCMTHKDGTRVGETVDADPSEEDLQKSMLAAATLEAAQFLLVGAAKFAYIQLFKTTKTHGTVSDRSSDIMDINDAIKIAQRSILRHARGY